MAGPTKLEPLGGARTELYLYSQQLPSQSASAVAWPALENQEAPLPPGYLVSLQGLEKLIKVSDVRLIPVIPLAPTALTSGRLLSHVGVITADPERDKCREKHTAGTVGVWTGLQDCKFGDRTPFDIEVTGHSAHICLEQINCLPSPSLPLPRFVRVSDATT